MELIGFRCAGSEYASLSLELLLSVLEPLSGRPLIYTGDAHRFTESQSPVHTRIRVGLYLFLTFNTSLHTSRFTATSVEPTTALGLCLASWALTLLNY